MYTAHLIVLVGEVDVVVPQDVLVPVDVLQRQLGCRQTGLPAQLLVDTLYQYLEISIYIYTPPGLPANPPSRRWEKCPRGKSAFSPPARAAAAAPAASTAARASAWCWALVSTS